MTTNPHIGSSFDDWLKEEGIYEEVTAAASRKNQMRTPYTYPATLEMVEDRFLVRFPDLPEALTDGTDEAEALNEAADCLSEALASRIVDGEEIPKPTFDAGTHLIAPDPTIALKTALYVSLRKHDMMAVDLALLDEILPFAEAMLNPREPSPALREAAKRYRDVMTKIDASLKRLDERIVAEHSTMDRLLDRIKKRTDG